MFRHPNAILRGLLVPFLSYSSFSLHFGWVELLFAWCGHLLRNPQQMDAETCRGFNEHKLLATPLSIS
jgi:hypothetical protein